MERRASERGFSLVELMVAMVITGIISGAIYGLLSSGQSAFRREPALVDRQQNIRIAMDLIQKDVLNAGAGMPWTQQTFSRTLPAPSAVLLNGHGPAGLAGNTDWLEIAVGTAYCPPVVPCFGASQPNNQRLGGFATWGPLPACYTLPAIVFVSGSLLNTCGGGGNQCPCPGGTPYYGFALAVQPPVSNPVCAPSSGAADNTVNYATVGRFAAGPANNSYCAGSATFAQVVLYQIIIAAGVPDLWRSSTGGVGPTGANDPGELVARGIEDLQVRYTMAGGGLPLEKDSPDVVVPTDYNTIVRKVRVTLSARALAPNLGSGAGAGLTGGGPLGAAVRGQLTTEISPRPALLALKGPGPPAVPAGLRWR